MGEGGQRSIKCGLITPAVRGVKKKTLSEERSAISKPAAGSAVKYTCMYVTSQHHTIAALFERRKCDYDTRGEPQTKFLLGDEGYISYNM